MTRATVTVAVVFLCTAAAAPEVIFLSPCECHGFHGKNRWVAKTDQAAVPADKSEIQSVTPSQIYAWEGLKPDVDLTGTTEERIPAEQKWYALTARLPQKLKQTATFTLTRQDATGDNRESSLSKYQQNRNGVQYFKKDVSAPFTGGGAG